MRVRLDNHESPLTSLKQLLRDWQVMHGQPGSSGCMLGTNIADFKTNDEAIAKILRGYVQQLEDLFTATLVRAQREGELSKTANPRNLARLILCMTQGVALLGRVMEKDTTLKGAVDAAIALLDES